MTLFVHVRLYQKSGYYVPGWIRFEGGFDAPTFARIFEFLSSFNLSGKLNGWQLLIDSVKGVSEKSETPAEFVDRATALLNRDKEAFKEAMP